MADFQVAVSYSVDDRFERLHSIEAQLNRVLSQSPNNAGAHFLMGRILNQTNRQAQAIDELNRALTLNPNLASAHAIIGLAKLYDGHPEETESHELEALRASPRDTDAYFWVGWMAEAKLYLGAYEDALNLCHRSIELNRNYPTARFTYCAAILVELGRLDCCDPGGRRGRLLPARWRGRGSHSGATPGAAQRSGRPDNRRASRTHRQAHRRRQPHRIQQRGRRRALRDRGAERDGRTQRRPPPGASHRLPRGHPPGRCGRGGRRRSDARRRLSPRGWRGSPRPARSVCPSRPTGKSRAGSISLSPISARRSSRTSPNRSGSIRCKSGSPPGRSLRRRQSRPRSHPSRKSPRGSGRWAGGLSLSS